VIEIDAASQRRIEDVRDLREKVHFSPAESTYKVYILDEVHMMTTDAFNALLKTLEEPPAHVIFILATTEVHKVPATVTSRCQRFDFNRIAHHHIEERLSTICEAEGVHAEPQVLRTIARSASGSLRDAENMLEQLVVAYDSAISLNHVKELLGIGDDELALNLVGHILRKQTRDGLTVINSIADQGLDIRRFHRQLLGYLREILLIKAGAIDPNEQTLQTKEFLGSLSKVSTMDQIVKAVRVFEQAAPSKDGPPTLPLELALVESAIDPELPNGVADEEYASQSPQESFGELKQSETIGAVESPKTAGNGLLPSPARQMEVSDSTTNLEPAVPISDETRDIDKEIIRHDSNEEYLGEPDNEAKQQEINKKATSLDLEENRQSNKVSAQREYPGNPEETDGHPKELPEDQWRTLLKATKTLKPKRFNIGSLLLDCMSRLIDQDSLVLVYKNRANMERLEEELETPEGRRLIQAAVEQATGTSYTIRLSLGSESEATAQHSRGHLVRSARAMGVHIVKEEDIT
jgi:DNA polymerase III subunit gamma/tau